MIYYQGDFWHWVDLFNYFEGFFEEFIKDNAMLSLDKRAKKSIEIPISPLIQVCKTVAFIFNKKLGL